MRWRLATATSKWTATYVAAAFVALWIGSLFFVAAWTRIPTPNHLIEIAVYGGRLRCYETFVFLRGWTKPPPTELKLQREPMAWGFKYEEVSWQWSQMLSSSSVAKPSPPPPSPAQLAHPAWQTRNIYIPLWAPVLPATLLAAAFWFFDTRAHRRKLKGCCASCGYTRRGLVPDAPCPECGKPSPSPP